LTKELNLSKELIDESERKIFSSSKETHPPFIQGSSARKKMRLVSFPDPDTRFGRKSKDKKFAGYKAHIAEDESQIIASCETLPGDENEGGEAHFEALLKKEDKKGLKGEAKRSYSSLNYFLQKKFYLRI